MKFKDRKLSQSLLFSLKNHPVVFVNGPRQAGKSTLVRNLAKKDYPAPYISFDQITHLEAALTSPEDFLKAHKAPVIIDEVQRAPSLFLPLKLIVDENRFKKKSKNSQYLLTGSSNIMAEPEISQSLVGRMSIKTLYPFSVSEILKTKGDFLNFLFKGDFASAKQNFSLNRLIYEATFPEISNKNKKEFHEWFESYLITLLQRDIGKQVELEKFHLLPKMLKILSSQIGRLLNEASIAREVGLNPVTSKVYRHLFNSLFLTFEVPPWYRNIKKRLVKASKVYLIDTALLCHLLGWEINEMAKKRSEIYGHVIENFVATELVKLLSFSQERCHLFHFRTHDSIEVDFVLEKENGLIAAIEVKASQKISRAHFKGLRFLKETVGKDFACGVIFYSGKDVVCFGEKLFALPFPFLWK